MKRGGKFLERTEVGGAGFQGQLSGGRWCLQISSYQIPKKN